VSSKLLQAEIHQLYVHALHLHQQWLTSGAQDEIALLVAADGRLAEAPVQRGSLSAAGTHAAGLPCLSLAGIVTVLSRMTERRLKSEPMGSSSPVAIYMPSETLNLETGKCKPKLHLQCALASVQQSCNSGECTTQ